MQSVLPLIEKWENFQQEKSRGGMYEFASWLLASKKKASPSMQASGTIGILLTRLQKHLGAIVKPEIQKLGFTKEHEYSFLYQISRMNKPNKNQLARENMLELSTGRDIVNRLLQKGLVTESPDPEDGRAMIIRLTAKGTAILKKSVKLLAHPFVDFAGDLSDKEQADLIRLLTKMEEYHDQKRGGKFLSSLD
jgi:DNA-binding MarR family transcriptional regulator